MVTSRRKRRKNNPDGKISQEADRPAVSEAQTMLCIGRLSHGCRAPQNSDEVLRISKFWIVERGARRWMAEQFVMAFLFSSFISSHFW